jgi:acyl-CoA synthetase (AMP-forming)/AMP-acid ligase II
MNDPKTLAEALQMSCAHWGDRSALVGNGEILSYTALHERAFALGRAYRRLGITAGDRILCQLSNCPEHVIAIYGAWQCGAIHAGADRLLTPTELSSLAALIGPSAIVYEPVTPDDNWVEHLHVVRQRCPDAQIIVKTSDAVPASCLRLSDLISATETRCEGVAGSARCRSKVR